MPKIANQDDNDGWTQQHKTSVSRLKAKAKERVSSKICQIVIFCVLIPITMVVDTVMIVIGALNLHKCPVEPNIPIFLIVFGASLLHMSLMKLLLKIRHICKKPDSSSSLDYCLGLALFLLFLFNVIWTIIFACYLFPVYPPEYEDTGSPKYCNDLAFIFSFKAVIVHIIMFGLIIIVGGCCSLCYGWKLMQRKNTPQQK